MEFPSPCGEMGMKRDWQWRKRKDRSRLVSVPLRGNGYETFGFNQPSTSPVSVSVPLRGNGCETGATTTVKKTVNRFPSPCGVMGVKHRGVEYVPQQNISVSVPLRGNGCETGRAPLPPKG